MNLDKTYCASSGTCARQSCPHWLDWHDVPKGVHVSLADLKDHLGYCPGYVENPVVSRIRWIVGA